MESPCISVCLLEDGVCVGCHRTVDEIRYWSRMTDEEQNLVIERIR
jgi:predicted Fe-S protein YdhL (DUF1289 family)